MMDSKFIGHPVTLKEWGNKKERRLERMIHTTWCATIHSGDHSHPKEISNYHLISQKDIILTQRTKSSPHYNPQQVIKARFYYARWQRISLMTTTQPEDNESNRCQRISLIDFDQLTGRRWPSSYENTSQMILSEGPCT